MRASFIAQSVKNLPAVQQMWVQFLGQEDPLEKEMATHSSILAWRIPWKVQSMGSQSWTRLRDSHFGLSHFVIYAWAQYSLLIMSNN